MQKGGPSTQASSGRRSFQQRHLELGQPAQNQSITNLLTELALVNTSFRSIAFFRCLQTVTHKEFFPHILMRLSLRTKLEQGSATVFTFLVFQSNFLQPRWTSFIWISIFSKPKKNYFQSTLLPAGGPTLYLTYFVHNPGEIILTKMQTKMGSWKIYMRSCLQT